MFPLNSERTNSSHRAWGRILLGVISFGIAPSEGELVVSPISFCGLLDLLLGLFLCTWVSNPSPMPVPTHGPFQG